MAEADFSRTQDPTESLEETPKVEAKAEDVVSEVQRVNRILEIENMDWERQLRQAVSGHNFPTFCLLDVVSLFPLFGSPCLEYDLPFTGIS